MDWCSVKFVVPAALDPLRHGARLARSGVIVQPAVVLQLARTLAMPHYRITITGPDKAAMAALLHGYDIEISEHGTHVAADTGYTVTALAAPDAIHKLRQSGYAVVQHEDADEVWMLRQREVGQGNRYTSAAERGSSGYLNVEEVESALIAAAAAPYSKFAELIILPEKTWERRQCHALKIGSGSGANRIGVYFLGGVHAREWGSCDILINFIERIEQAYLNGTALAFGPKTFSAAEIRSIVDTLDIVIFPQANPDGRFYSMTVKGGWRKNRRPAPPGPPEYIGVDLNRNFDFMWDFSKYFAKASGNLTSTNPGTDFYCGESAFSEPETRNARWIADRFTNIRFFMDLHSFGPDILYRWGDALDQTKHRDMNFMNPCYDGKRGINNPEYEEYIVPDDLAASLSLGAAMHDGIKAVRGTDYTVDVSGNLYPSSGASDDYLYSRHLTDPGQPKILSFTLEWGDTHFHPPYDEMRQIIDEVTAGLLAFCLKIVAMTKVRGAM
jgi:carboxypeptidase T